MRPRTPPGRPHLNHCVYVRSSFCPPQAVSCGAPKAPANGGVVTADYSVGTRVSYFCSDGYRLSSKELTSAICQPDGTWSNHNKIPRFISCGELPSPPSGKKIGTQTTFGATAIFACDAGFMLVGSAVRECLSSGLWSGTESRCLAGHCGIPEGIVNGNGFNLNDVVSFVCNRGYQMEGPARAHCQANRQWSHPPPTCKEKKNPQAFSHIKILELLKDFFFPPLPYYHIITTRERFIITLHF
uniref:Sushi domain-containing protein n=1 Tax=Hippocampus comes TaxID=109280 RepID=A0A3Q3DHT7_HIPCM